MNAKLAVVQSAPTLADLAYQWRSVKEAEKAANAKRLEIESQMLELVDEIPEGTVTKEVGDVKVKVTYKLTRSVDTKLVIEDWNSLPPLVQEAFKWEPGLVLKQLRAIETANPDAFALLSYYVTSKGAKPSVSVEVD